MPINFPYPPSLNQIYSYNGKTWQWNGIYWEVYPDLVDYLTGATSLGSGTSVFNSISNRQIRLNSITGDSTNKLSTSISSDTIELGINEQNLTLWDLVVQGNKLISGSVSYVSGLTFSVSPLQYLINGEIYNISTPSTVILQSGDSTYDRIDVIYADINGNTGVLEGTPSPNPEKSLVDGDTQVEVTFVLVGANSTTAEVTSLIIYNEDTGPPSEWEFLSFGPQSSRIIGNSTADAYSGTTSIQVSGVTGVYTNYFRLSGLTDVNTNNYATIQFALKNLSANTTSSRIRLRFLSNTGTQNGSQVFINAAGSSGYIQYSSTNISSWQLISIPLWRFYLTNTNVTQLEVAFYPIGTGAQSRYYFDLFEFVEGTASSPPSNSWSTIQSDGLTSITAPSPNSTLSLLGGTNINTSISGSTSVLFNLNGNINLSGITATTKTTIGTEANISSAILQVSSTTKGILFPRMTNNQRETISSPTPGLFVYCTDFPEGLFMYKSTGWVQIM